MHRMTRRLRATLGHALVVRACALTLIVTAAVAVAPVASGGADRQTRASAARTFTPIEVPGATFTTAIGINARGQIVGGFRDAGGVIHGFLLDKGVFTEIVFPGEVTRIFSGGAPPIGINDRGQIVSEFKDTAGVFHGFLLDDGAFAQIDFPGAVDTSAAGINNRGQIVGGFHRCRGH